MQHKHLKLVPPLTQEQIDILNQEDLNRSVAKELARIAMLWGER